MNKFSNLIKLFAKLPGVGPRQATRFVLALLNEDENTLIEFAKGIANLKQEIKICNQCFYITDDKLCHICTNSKRNHNQIMVVEKISDLEAVERTRHYKGLYHVLGGTINPPDGITPEKLTINSLVKRIKKESEKIKDMEIILALSPTPFGNTTGLFIQNELKNLKDIKLSNLARGISFGSSIEYIDELTLKESFERRR